MYRDSKELYCLASPTSWRENRWHRYGMKKLRHCHPVLWISQSRAQIHNRHCRQAPGPTTMKDGCKISCTYRHSPSINQCFTRCKHYTADFCNETVKHQFHVLRLGREVTKVRDGGPTAVQCLLPRAYANHNPGLVSQQLIKTFQTGVRIGKPRWWT